ncbi:hypothetical protein ACOME3_001341 [Neoechinorhynchus agilis]
MDFLMLKDDSGLVEFDSDVEEPSNTIGQGIPLRWYDRLDHVGYSLQGKPISKSASDRVNAIDEFLARIEDDDHWRTVYDSLTGQKIVLSEEDVKLARNLSLGANITRDSYAPWEDLFSATVETEPLIDPPPSKRRFIPSIDRHRAIGQLVSAIKSGWIKPDSIVSKGVQEALKANVIHHVRHDLWAKPETERRTRPTPFLVAPKIIEPSHEDSYAPAIE